MASAREIAALREALPDGVSSRELERAIDNNLYPEHLRRGFETLAAIEEGI